MRTAVRNSEHSILKLSPFTEINYERTYSLTSLIFIFFTFSTIGYIWEVILHIIEDGMFINRGIMVGPWLPIYGFGGVLVLTLLKRWRDSPLKTLFMIMLVCGITEYITSLLLESFFGAKWWDYSDMMFNLHGRVCLEGLLIFGIGGLIFIYVAAPRFDDWLKRFSQKTKTGIIIFLLLVFIGDFIHTIISPNMGMGITN